MPAPRRALERTLLAVAALTVSLAPALIVPEAAHAAGPAYVALGDSYSSGVGTRSYIDDGTECQRSTFAYPSLIAARRGYALDLRACSGARIPDVANTQLGALGAATNYVTVSVGGNDAGFADVLTECATPWWAGDCDGAIDQAQAYINNQLPGALSSLYGSIRAAAPTAKVVVVGYPRIFMGEDCNAATWFSPKEEARLNQMADLINSRTSAQASGAGFSFANPTNAFLGHAVCDNPEWLNGLSNPISESYHPNRDGQASGYTPTVSPVLTGAGFTVTAATLRAAAANRDELAAQQRKYAALDASIEPATFRVPDLSSPAMRKAARQAGIDLDRWLARH
jgi:lysophospholipase L1-like esterase